MSANDRQIGGEHYKGKAIEHWDIVAQHNLDYFQGQITKYVMRWKKKGGVQDLQKAKHFLDKYIELEEGKAELKYAMQAQAGQPLQPPQQGYGDGPVIKRPIGDRL